MPRGPWEEASLQQIANARATLDYPFVLGGALMPNPIPTIQATARLTKEEYEWLRIAAQKRDISISTLLADLVRKEMAGK